eukprot:365011-Chlamydomonas_euryale.AAC.37
MLVVLAQAYRLCTSAVVQRRGELYAGSQVVCAGSGASPGWAKCRLAGWVRRQWCSAGVDFAQARRLCAPAVVHCQGGQSAGSEAVCAGSGAASARDGVFHETTKVDAAPGSTERPSGGAAHAMRGPAYMQLHACGSVQYAATHPSPSACVPACP